MSALQYAQPVVDEEGFPVPQHHVAVEIEAGPKPLIRLTRMDLDALPGFGTLPGLGKWINSRRRRALDCVVATLALVVLSPLFFLLALLVRLSSPGPIFFRQGRMGRHGIEFTLYKFRSMHVTDASGSPITVVGDSRITRLGAFLRRYKLDELPQFWNVLKGDMSLVGPRPKLPEHEALFLCVRPGLTGAATLAFRQEEEVLAGVPEHQLESFYHEVIKPSKAWIDTEYITNATFRSDLRLLSDTCTSCLGISRLRSTEEWISIYQGVQTTDCARPPEQKRSA